MFSKSLIIFILFIILISLTSCTGARELDTLGIVVTTGVDLVDGKIIITNEVINPAAGAGAKGTDVDIKTEFVQGSGYILGDAIARTLLSFDRELYYPHNQLIIFGEECAKNGIGAYIDAISRDTEQRESAFLLVAKGDKAYNIMGIDSGISGSPGKYLYDILNGEKYNGQTRTLTLSEFLRYYYRSNEGYILGEVHVLKKPEINKMKSSNTLDVLCVEGGAVFTGDKLVGYYSGDEMIGFNILVDELKSTDIIFDTPNYIEDTKRQIASKGKYSDIRVVKSKTKLDIKLEHEELHLYINVKIGGKLMETMELLDINNPATLKIVEQACAKKVKEIIGMTLRKGQKEFGVDSFSIGELVHRKYPKLWKVIKDDWSTIFAELGYTIDVNVTIGDTGFTNMPPNLRRSKKNE